MKNFYILIFTFLITTFGFSQTSLNFTIDNAIDYGGTGGVSSPDYRIEETLNVGGDTYLLKVTCVTDLVLEDLGGGNNIFYSAFSETEIFTLFKNGNPVTFNFVSIDFDNPFDEAGVTIKNSSGNIISQNVNAGGQLDGFPASGTITPNNTSNAININAFEIEAEIPNSLNDVGWHNIKLEIPPPGPIITPDANNIIYVNKNVSSGSENGSSWTNATPELADALIWAKQNPNPSWATTPLQIWVATDTYKPGVNETDSFEVAANINVLGGFNGTETAANERNWVTNPTILSGDLNNNNTADVGDSHTIVSLLANNVTLDGFIIQNSFADDETDNSQIAIGRAGAGIYINNAENINIYHCIFNNNIAHGNGTDNGVGGAVINFGNTSTNTTITNSLFFNNSATASGGAISGESGNIDIVNCTLANNNATNGGGIHLFASNIIINNSIFTNNSGTNGNINNGGAGTSSAAYSLFYNSTSGNNGNIPTGVVDGTNNIENTDPIYNSINNVNGYKIKSNSAAIDAGNNLFNNSTLDLDNNNRIFNTTIDIGAYESQTTLSTDVFNTSLFKIYPNPVNNILNIKIPNQEYNYSIYNTQGQEILKANNQTSKTIDVSKLPTGIYMLKLFSNNKTESFKIIKQ